MLTRVLHCVTLMMNTSAAGLVLTCRNDVILKARTFLGKLNRTRGTYTTPSRHLGHLGSCNHSRAICRHVKFLLSFISLASTSTQRYTKPCRTLGARLGKNTRYRVSIRIDARIVRYRIESVRNRFLASPRGPPP